MPKIEMSAYGSELLDASGRDVPAAAMHVSAWYAELARVGELLVEDGWSLETYADDHCQYAVASGRVREVFDLAAVRARYASEELDWIISIDDEMIAE